MTEKELIEETKGNEEDVTPRNDLFLNCLIYISRRLGHTSSRHAALSALPLEADELLTMETFVRAAENLKLSARVDHVKFHDISHANLPLVLILKNEKPCVLTGFDQHYVDIYWGEGEETHLHIDSFISDYADVCISLKPMDTFKESHSFLAASEDKGWLESAWRDNSFLLGKVLLSSLFINLFVLALPLFIMNVYDRVVPNESHETLLVLSIGVVLVFIFDFILKLLRSYFVEYSSREIDLTTSAKLYAKIMNLKMSSLPARSGSLLHAVKEYDSIRQFFTSGALLSCADVPFILLFVAVIYMLGGAVVVPLLVAIPLVLLVSYFSQQPLLHTAEKALAERVSKNSLLMESIYGIETVKSSNAQNYFQKRWEGAVESTANLNMKMSISKAFSTNFTMLVQQLALISVLIIGVGLIMEKELTVGALVACTILTSRSMAPVGKLVLFFSNFQRAMVSLKSLNKLMDSEVERDLSKTYLDLNEIQGDIEFINVSFTYPGSKVPVLKNVSFKILSGEKVGVIGKTGAGKSTLLKLILGFYKPDEGQILIDGLEINQLDPAVVRGGISYLSQESFLFSGSLRENITLGSGRKATSEELIHAAHLAGIDQFVNNRHQGYDYWVGERGQGLSGGQKQGVALARTFMNDSPVLILDEPTSAMDSQNELEFIRNVQPHVKDKTLFIVSHRIAMLSLADRILVLENGSLVADGGKEAIMRLLSKKGVG